MHQQVMDIETRLIGSFKKDESKNIGLETKV